MLSIGFISLPIYYCVRTVAKHGQDQCVGDWGVQSISTAATTHLIPIVKHSHDAWSLQLLQV